MDNLLRTIDSCIESKDYDGLSAVFSDVNTPSSWQSVGPGEQRSLAAHVLQQAVASATFFPDALNQSPIVDVLIKALKHLPATVEQAADNQVRELLFEHFLSRHEYSTAARILADTRMEDDTTSVYYTTPAHKADVYVKIAECFLAEDEIVESDAAVTKAGSVVESIPNKEQHTTLILRYKSTYARVLDANRKFLAAAQRYHELSKSRGVDAEELLQLLGRAVTCAILAPSGPQRQRVLGLISQDERLVQLDSLPEYSTHSRILRKMVRHQILQPSELVQLEASLQEHQKAVMGDGLTILERGVVEHNMIAVANLYKSIYFDDLARILGVSISKAERIAASMILEGSLHGSMDQVQGLLEFEPAETKEQAWDRSITSWCLELNKITEAVVTARTTTQS